jgi:hypothetical protein
MPNFAVIENNVVINVILADTLEDAEQATGFTCIEYTDASPIGIGWIFNGERFDNPATIVIQSPATE